MYRRTIIVELGNIVQIYEEVNFSIIIDKFLVFSL